MRRFKLPRLTFLLATGIVSVVTVNACQETEPTPMFMPPTPAHTATPDQSIVLTAWEESSHSQTYALEKGPNTYCARCHSPGNWDPVATIDEPPNCVTCKFVFEDEPRIAAGNPLVPEEDWASIGCDVCHRQENGHVDPTPVWYNQKTAYYETVVSATELCEKCHLDNETLKHRRHKEMSAHAEFVCTDCHDAHSTATSCNNCHDVELSGIPQYIDEHETVSSNEDCSKCHTEESTTHNMNLQQAGTDDCFECHGELMGRPTTVTSQYGHTGYHSQVLCVACHDASSLEVGPVEGEGVWITYRTTKLLGRENTEPYQSHQVQLAVECTRCHYPDNPWSLSDNVGDKAVMDLTQ